MGYRIWTFALHRALIDKSFNEKYDLLGRIYPVGVHRTKLFTGEIDEFSALNVKCQQCPKHARSLHFSNGVTSLYSVKKGAIKSGDTANEESLTNKSSENALFVLNKLWCQSRINYIFFLWFLSECICILYACIFSKIIHYYLFLSYKWHLHSRYSQTPTLHTYDIIIISKNVHYVFIWLFLSTFLWNTKKKHFT